MAHEKQTRALWYMGEGECALKGEILPDMTAGNVLVRTLWSGISRGTERLVFEGRVPASEQDRMRCPHQQGQFPFPVKYGYCAVGLVEAGPDEFMGQTIFALHPHQERFVVPASAVTLVPEGLSPRRAVLAANMETALNGLWDAQAGPGDRIVVVGGGVLGLLVASLAAGLPEADVTLVDVDASRQLLADHLGFGFALPGQAPEEADIVIHTSATGAGLATAITAAGMEATVLELSWHGAGDIPVALGGAFHAKRLRLISSQVGQVSPSRRPRWTYARRLAKALELLRDDRLDALITIEIAFENAPAALPALFAPGAAGLTAVLRY